MAGSRRDQCSHLAQVCAPRFSVLAQTWREDDDGTYIVLLRSMDHPAAQSPPPVPGFWLHPVPVNVRVMRLPNSVSRVDSVSALIHHFWMTAAIRHLCTPMPGEQLPSDSLFAVSGVPEFLVICCIPMLKGIHLLLHGVSVQQAVKLEHSNRARAMQLVAAGFTIAPLQPRFTGGGASGECLVTLVLKVDDLGGWLSTARLGALVRPWLRSVLAEAAAGAVIALRDKVHALQCCPHGL